MAMAAHGSSRNPDPQPDPGILLRALSAYQLPMALKGAIELEIFTHIAAGANTVAQIAPLAKASEKGVRVLCDYLTINGFLTKHRGVYALAPETGIFLDKKSPAYMGSVASFLAHEMMRKNFSDVAALVRNGGAVFHEMLGPDDPIWVEFARSMAPMMGVPAEILALQTAGSGPIRVMDIAAGHGLFGIFVARQNPQAVVTAVDWANVLEVAKENALKMGVAERFHTIPGSAFEVDLGTGYDLVLLPNFLHHFDEPTCVSLLKRLRAAMKPTGVLATVEFVPNEDRVSPPHAAAFSMMMLGGTESGDAYTFNELKRMVDAAGFGATELHSLAPAPQSLLLTRYV
jgi:2-polyprenyl-3-methyl-5-hydroxy-6-metoxy-1,4-benzoquinol methylase